MILISTAGFLPKWRRKSSRAIRSSMTQMTRMKATSLRVLLRINNGDTSIEIDFENVFTVDKCVYGMFGYFGTVALLVLELSGARTVAALVVDVNSDFDVALVPEMILVVLPASDDTGSLFFIERIIGGGLAAGALNSISKTSDFFVVGGAGSTTAVVGAITAVFMLRLVLNNNRSTNMYQSCGAWSSRCSGRH